MSRRFDHEKLEVYDYDQETEKAETRLSSSPLLQGIYEVPLD